MISTLNVVVFIIATCTMCYVMTDLSFGKFLLTLVALVAIVGCTIVEYSK